MSRIIKIAPYCKAKMQMTEDWSWNIDRVISILSLRQWYLQSARLFFWLRMVFADNWSLSYVAGGSTFAAKATRFTLTPLHGRIWYGFLYIVLPGFRSIQYKVLQGLSSRRGLKIPDSAFKSPPCHYGQTMLANGVILSPRMTCIYLNTVSPFTVLPLVKMISFNFLYLILAISKHFRMTLNLLPMSYYKRHCLTLDRVLRLWKY